MTAPRTALLLVNLGTPDAPTVDAVKPYLGEFLMDKRVISIPTLLRWILVNVIILNTRPKKSAAAYQKVWTDEGSPLRIAHDKLTDAVKQALDDDDTVGADVVVDAAMRYGQPSIKSVVQRLQGQGVERFVVFPLYPQYASSTTGTVMEEVMDIVRTCTTVPAVAQVPAFFDDDAFIDATLAAGAELHTAFNPDHVLFSFHGLPQEHLTDAHPQHCLSSSSCCERVGAENRFCYRAQCTQTAKAIAGKLGLDDDGWSMSFQSRLGKAEWIRPYTDDVVEQLAKDGKKRLAVYCPAFVADCLETLEEIGMEAKEEFIAAGGEDLQLIPCVNDHPVWVDGVVQLAKRTSSWLTSD